MYLLKVNERKNSNMCEIFKVNNKDSKNKDKNSKIEWNMW